MDIEHPLEGSAIIRIKHPRWVTQRVFHTDERLDADIHLEHGKAACEALL